MNFPYRDPVLPYLPPPEPEQVEALRHAASTATGRCTGSPECGNGIRGGAIDSRCGAPKLLAQVVDVNLLSRRPPRVFNPKNA